MVVRKTLQWIATLLLLAGVGGGGYSYWFFTHSDEQLRAKIYEFVGKKLPNARLEIGRAWFWGHKVHLQNVLLSAKGLDQPLARCAEIVVTLDGEELSDELRIDVRAVHVVRPDVRIMRDSTGHWNWEKILPLPEPDEMCPEVAFDDLQVALQLAHGTARDGGVSHSTGRGAAGPLRAESLSSRGRFPAARAWATCISTADSISKSELGGWAAARLPGRTSAIWSIRRSAPFPTRANGWPPLNRTLHASARTASSDADTTQLEPPGGRRAALGSRSRGPRENPVRTPAGRKPRSARL